MVAEERRGMTIPSCRPMARLSDVERALIGHKPASLKFSWPLLRWLPGRGLNAPLNGPGLSELIRHAAACEVEYVVGEWLRQGATLTGVELQLLRAQPLPRQPGPLLSASTIAEVLASWRLGATNLHEQMRRERIRDIGL